MNITELKRERQLIKNLPNILAAQTVLYIGANAQRFHFQDLLRYSADRTDVIEIDADRCKECEAMGWLHRVIHGDVCTIDQLIEMPTFYDVVLWSHGPEILERHEIVPTIEKLLGITNDVLICLCPWGRYEYAPGEKEGLRDSDINRTALYPDDFLEQGFSVSVIGEKDTRGSNLLAWKYV